MTTREQTAVRAELQARKAKIEEQMALVHFDEIITFGVEKGLIKEYGFGFLFDMENIRYDFARHLYENGMSTEDVVKKTQLEWTVVHQLAAAVDATVARAHDREQIERVCLPGALGKSIDKTKISVRTYNLLSAHGIRVIGDMLRYTYAQLEMIDGVGPKVYADIKQMLADHKVVLMA